MTELYPIRNMSRHIDWEKNLVHESYHPRIFQEYPRLLEGKRPTKYTNRIFIMKYDDRYPLKDYLNSINLNKENLMDSDDPAWEKNYPAYVVNKCMSHHMDTVLFANEMNRYSFLPSRLQYDFYIHIVRPRKRFSPWGKRKR